MQGQVQSIFIEFFNLKKKRRKILSDEPNFEFRFVIIYLMVAVR